MPHIICLFLKLNIEVRVSARRVLRVYQLKLVVASKILHNRIRVEPYSLGVLKCSWALVAILLNLLLHFLFHFDTHLLAMINTHLDDLERTLNETCLN